MKRKSLLKVLILFILAGNIANAEYLKENGEVYYKMPYYEIKSKVKDVDIESFETLREDEGLIGDYYAKDNKNVYLFGKKLKDVLPEGFEVVKESYVKDSKNLYKLEVDDIDQLPMLSSYKINTKKISIDGLDVKTFRNLENEQNIMSMDYFVDKNSIYYDDYENLKKIQGADKNSFEITGYYIAKDKNNVYYKGIKLENVDSKSFEDFDNFIAKDKNRVFYIEGNGEIENVDVASFEMIEDTRYFRDKNNIFVIKYGNNFPDGQGFVKLKNIDKNSFTALSKDIGKDKNGVYYLDKKINGISPNNTKVIEEIGQDNYILKSGNNYYLTFNSNKDSYDRENEKIEVKKINGLNIDFETFKYFGIFDYYKDKNSFYYRSDNDLKKIKSGIDVKSAEDVFVLNNFVKDKDNLYYFSNGKITKINLKIDVNSLEMLEDRDSSYSNYIKDNKNVYFVDNENGTVKLIKNADKNTFKVVEKIYGVDGKNVYYDGEKLDFVGVDGLKIFDENYLKDNKNVYEIYTTDDEKTKVRAIKNLNIDVASFENILKGTFYKDKNSIYYVDVDFDWNKRKLKKLEGADVDTFEPGIFSKDKNRVYIGKQKLKDVSPKGFEVVSGTLDFVKDYKNIYYLDRADDGITVKVKKLDINGIDIPSFESVDNSLLVINKYFRDNKNVYFIIQINNKFEIKKVNGANPKTFEVLEGYAKDDKNIYLYLNKLDGVDVKTFKMLDYEMAKDKNGLYALDRVEIDDEVPYFKIHKLNIKGLDFQTFENINESEYYYKDKSNVYYKSDENLYKIESADIKTFEILDSDYTGYGNFSKDKNNIYLNNKKLEGIDVKTFEKMQANLIKDKNGIYKVEEDEGKHEFKIVPINARIDFKNLKNLDWGYFKVDKNIYYFDGDKFEKIEGADANSFEKVEYSSLYKDKNYVYYNGKKIVGMDSKDIGNIDEEWSIEEVNGTWIKYKDNVYYKGKKIKGTSSDSFNYFDGGLSYETILSDKNGIYKFIESENDEKTIEVTKLDSKGIDLKTLERIYSQVDSSNYFKDKNGVYFMDGKKFVKVNGADKDSFRVTMTGKYGKDKNNVYFEGKKMEGENPIEFEEEMEIRQ